MGKSTGFSQSAYGLIQFMGKAAKHPHISYMYLHMRSKKIIHPSSVPLNTPILAAQVYNGGLFVVIFVDVVWISTGAAHWWGLCVCVCAGNICAFRGTAHPHQQRSHEQGSSVCQYGASLTFGVLLKVLTEGTLRGLCPLSPAVSLSLLL